MKKALLLTLILPLMAGCLPEKDKEAGAGVIKGLEWVVEDIDGKGIIDNSHLTLTFGDDGRVFGSAGCNRYTGGYELSETTLEIAPGMASTRMACMAPALGEQENTYLSLLPSMTRAELDEEGKALRLSGEKGTLLYRLQ